MTTGAVRRAKLHSNCRHLQTNIQFFYRPDVLRVAQPTVSEHWWEKKAKVMAERNCLRYFLIKDGPLEVWNSICKIYCRLLCSPAWSAKQYNLVLKQYNLVPANGRWCLAAGKVTVGLASHWPCVTDNSGITAGLMALEREISTPPIPSRSVAQFTLSLLSSLIMVVHNQSVVLVYLTI